MGERSGVEFQLRCFVLTRLSQDLSSEPRTSLWVYQKFASLACKLADSGGLENSARFAASCGETEGAVP